MVELILKVTLFGLLGGVVHSLLDRWRGQTAEGWLKQAKRFIYAMAASLFVVQLDDGFWGALFPIIFFVGSIPGWGLVLGEAMGGADPSKKPAGWQKGALATNLQLALWVRGAMWLGPALLLFIPTHNPMYLIAPVAMTVAFAVSPRLSRYFPAGAGFRYEQTELIRGALYGAPVAAIAALLAMI